MEEHPHKVSFTVHIREDLIERVKNLVYWTPGLTLSGLTEKTLEEAVSEAERRNGGPFPPRAANLKPGRPLE